MNVADYMQTLGQQARTASRAMARASTNDKNRALLAIAKEISNSRDTLRSANAEDMARGEENGLDAALLDRLELTDARNRYYD